ncbi:MAG: helix-turn-helix transcriptional regulator [Elusimicrobiota bacterium]
MKKEFIILIKQSLDEKGMSLRELARRSGLDVSFLSKILNGKRNPPSNEKDIKKIAGILGLDQDRLLFAAGRIPSYLQKIFDNEDFIKKLVADNTGKVYGGEKQSVKTGRIKVEHRIPEIEDELL